MLRYVLTIDLGTSGPKVSLFDTQGRCAGYEFEEVPLLLTDAGGAEQRPSDWTNAISSCYRKLISRSGISPSQIIAVNCTSQWSGTVCLDKEGNVLMNAIIWMDTRGAKYVDKLTRGPIRVEGYGIAKILKWINLTGGGPTKSGKDSLAHILFLKNELPKVYERTCKFLEPKDYLNYWLTGRMCASFDSITLHWVTDNRDINNITYHDGLISLAGIDKEKLPELVGTNTVIGTVRDTIADNWGLSKNTPVISGTPDLHSAAVGSGAIRDYEGHLYVGTSSWLVCHVPFKKTDIFHNMATFPSAIPGRYVIANEQETAGACLNFLKNNIFYHTDALSSSPAPADFYKILDKIAATAPPGSDGVLFLPWLIGERSPIDDHTVRGGIFNLSLHHTRAHIMRSVLEGVALNARWLLMYVEKMTARTIDNIHFIGGGANSELWCSIMADVLNRHIHQVEQPLMANSRGAAILALLALREIDIDEAARSVTIRKVFSPNSDNVRLYDEKFECFVDIYNRNKTLFARLNQKLITEGKK
ncbi:MAG: FGGY-family carbohydrate kinase [Chitinophagales bacterium]|nr:FGGY-family carbohydrate kinase [Chitinophagales bacterium]MDW8418156.1 FGGY-family carbohydrate kinase [Chitinophagales bacterium]